MKAEVLDGIEKIVQERGEKTVAVIHVSTDANNGFNVMIECEKPTGEKTDYYGSFNDLKTGLESTAFWVDGHYNDTLEIDKDAN